MKKQWFITIYIVALLLLGWCFRYGISFNITLIFFLIVLVMSFIILMEIITYDPKEKLLEEIRDELRKKNKQKDIEPLEGEIIK